MIPFLYQSSHITLQTFWVFAVIALIATSYFSVKSLKRAKVNFNIFIEHGTFCVLFALFTSRVVFFTLNSSIYFIDFDFRTLINFLSIWDRGFSLWAGFVGFILALAWQIKKESESIAKWADALSVPFLYGFIIANFGAFLGGYEYGKPTNLPWGISYELYNVQYTVPVHPTQIYAIIGAIATIYLYNLYSKKHEFFKVESIKSASIAFAFFTLNFLLEFIRGDETIFILSYIRLPLIIFLILSVFTGRFLYKKHKEYGESLNTSADASKV